MINFPEKCEKTSVFLNYYKFVIFYELCVYIQPKNPETL